MLLAFSFVLFQFANATVWRVNNRPNVNADFTTLQAAIDSASDGDTLYIEASETSYGNGTFAKKLVVIGAGYWLNENDTTQAYKEESQTGMLTFNDGSQGSVVIGLFVYVQSAYNPHTFNINTDSINIERNLIHLYEDRNDPYYTGTAISISNNRSNINIKQNWIYSHRNGNYTTYAVYISGILSNSKINNNFIRATQQGRAIYMSTNSTATELVITNNVFWGNITTYYTIQNNNILVAGNYNNGLGDLTSHNLCNETQYPAVNSNLQNVDMETVFVDWDLYVDNGYILASGSPAIGAGLNGGDCGAFSNDSGDDPYVLSGMPPIPSVFEATVTTVGVSSLPVNIKASSHN